eukprot:gnl/TRDRNA2_/TRDRNA2_134973_c1_seq1.p1 gnl/TRDRNA2_/TRDRNA2_134973_c1~~gnl/TRDRNA2_/TRDRNA2_134973_c1_seq1.p1  ORF type:complete len:116 (-),score=10.28 gnl/TRDRNA2_/TRDRNA2_134973_c1_seq1:167-514(-)
MLSAAVRSSAAHNREHKLEARISRPKKTMTMETVEPRGKYTHFSLESTSSMLSLHERCKKYNQHSESHEVDQVRSRHCPDVLSSTCRLAASKTCDRRNTGSYGSMRVLAYRVRTR